MSSLISGNNVNISSNQDINVLASIVTGGGDGNLSAGNNLNVKSAVNQYYAMNYHMETSMDLGAVVVGAIVAVAVTAATGGAGLAVMATAGVGAQARSGSADTKVTDVKTVVGSSLLFNQNLSITADNAIN
jgi:hypothetical protein